MCNLHTSSLTTQLEESGDSAYVLLHYYNKSEAGGLGGVCQSHTSPWQEGLLVWSLLRQDALPSIVELRVARYMLVSIGAWMGHS